MAVVHAGLYHPAEYQQRDGKLASSLAFSASSFYAVCCKRSKTGGGEGMVQWSLQGKLLRRKAVNPICGQFA